MAMNEITMNDVSGDELTQVDGGVIPLLAAAGVALGLGAIFLVGVMIGARAASNECTCQAPADWGAD
jgi:lactobin A/cerein 7B family class IIb bacteriocin